MYFLCLFVVSALRFIRGGLNNNKWLRTFFLCRPAVCKCYLLNDPYPNVLNRPFFPPSVYRSLLFILQCPLLHFILSFPWTFGIVPFFLTVEPNCSPTRCFPRPFDAPMRLSRRCPAGKLHPTFLLPTPTPPTPYTPWHSPAPYFSCNRIFSIFFSMF